MSIPKSSIESQLRTKCNILESQVETLEKKIANRLNQRFKNDLEIDDLPFKVSTKWKEIKGIGKFPE